MIKISDFIQRFPILFPEQAQNAPWDITGQLPDFIRKLQQTLDDQYIINNEIAIHRSAVIEQGVVLKAPIIIGPNCFIGAHAYLRGGVWLDSEVKIGPGCELKTCMLFRNSAAAHFNFIGDSIIGEGVNFEAGSVIANHFNERADKKIWLSFAGENIDTGVEKFGAVVGDGTKVGANAVLSPGTVLAPGTVIGRLELV
jgi:NDP-sugar pyrophosphorylase family protein